MRPRALGVRADGRTGEGAAYWIGVGPAFGEGRDDHRGIAPVPGVEIALSDFQCLHFWSIYASDGEAKIGAPTG